MPAAPRSSSSQDHKDASPTHPTLMGDKVVSVAVHAAKLGSATKLGMSAAALFTDPLGQSLVIPTQTVVGGGAIFLLDSAKPKSSGGVR